MLTTAPPCFRLSSQPSSGSSQVFQPVQLMLSYIYLASHVILIYIYVVILSSIYDICYVILSYTYVILGYMYVMLCYNVNRLTPNDPYMGRTAPLTSKRCILYIYSTNIGTEYFKRALYSPFLLFKMQFVS